MDYCRGLGNANFQEQTSPGKNQQPSNEAANSSYVPTATEDFSSPSSSAHAASNAASISSNQAPPPRIRRRNRMITSCLECRRRKLKCDKSHPCTNCTKFRRDCVFLAPALDQASQLKLNEIKEKVGSLERLLERDVAKNPQSSTTMLSQDRALPDDADDELPANDDEKDLEVTPLAVVDAAYEVDGEDDDLLDLGIQLGKMRITERIGGFFRLKISEELELTMSETFMTGDKNQDEENVLSKPEVTSPPPATEWLKPGPAYILPTSGFFFGGTRSQASLFDFLPSRLAADKLIRQYFACVHPICQILHRPTFEKEWEAFWNEVTLGIEPPSSVQTIVFAAMFSGVVSMDDSEIMRGFGVSKASLTENFKLGTETALARANFLRTTKIETLQAFVMYLIPLCRAEMSRAHSVLLGAAIRMAECMGLHRDGQTYGMNPLETHVRRLVWHQLCFLDIRTCEAQGPRPTIRRDEFDTKLPLNVNDADLQCTGNAPVGADQWTDVTFSLIRFEVNEMIRTIWIDRPRIERRKISLTAVLSKIETFRSNMAARYDHLIDERIPLQKCARIVKALLMSRLQVMVLHRYHNSVVAPMPDRLRKIMLSAGTTTLETAIALETIPELKPWSWYVGAYQQYHTAFLLLMEVYIYPQRKEVDRIWACLDYIFEADASQPRGSKGKQILQELQQKTAVYQSMRGMRAPIVMEKHVGQREPRVADRLKAALPGQQKQQQQQQQQQHDSELLLYEQTAPPASASGMVSTVGRVPVAMAQDIQFAGVSDGQSLWALPNSQSSPEASSDTTNLPGQMAGNAAPAGALQDDLMADIDWDAFDALFPPGQQGEPEIIGFSFPGAQGGY